MDAVLTLLSALAARRHQGVRHAGQRADIASDPLGQVGGGGQRRAFGRADEHVVLRLVVLRQEVLADEHEERNDGEDHATLSATTTLRCAMDQTSMRV